MSFCGFLVGEFIWLAIQSQITHSWPQSIFAYPFMLGMTALWAQKRGEMPTLWSGSFYDHFLERNYRINSFFGDFKSSKKYIVELPMVLL